MPGFVSSAPLSASLAAEIGGGNVSSAPLLSLAGGGLPTNGLMPLSQQLQFGQDSNQSNSTNTVIPTAQSIAQQQSTNAGTSIPLPTYAQLKNMSSSDINNLLNSYYIQNLITQYSQPNAPGTVAGGIFGPGINPTEAIARGTQLGMAIPDIAYNWLRDLVGVGTSIKNLQYSQGIPSNLAPVQIPNPLPAAPTYMTQPVTNYLTGQLPSEITNYINSNTRVAPLPGNTTPVFNQLGVPLLNAIGAIDRPVAGGIAGSYPIALGKLGTGNLGPLETLYNTAFLGSSALLPGKSFGFG
jgi:hypothetical protein